MTDAPSSSPSLALSKKRQTAVHRDPKPNSTVLRRKCLKMDGNRCVNKDCRSVLRYRTDYLERHHIIKSSHEGPDTVENSIMLCPVCHKKAEEGYTYRVNRNKTIRITARQFMLWVLDQHIGTSYFRWDESYKYLLSKEQNNGQGIVRQSEDSAGVGDSPDNGVD